MIPSRRVGQSALFVLSLALLSSCASGPQFYANAPPIDMSPAAILARGTCTDLPVDKDGTMNQGAGWVKMTTAQMACGGKYASGAYRCPAGVKCGPLIYNTTPGEKSRGKVLHLLVDLCKGKVSGCAQPSQRFGWRGAIECKPLELAATDSAPIRHAFEVTVPALDPASSVQTATAIDLELKPVGSEEIVVCQLGLVESAAQ